MQQTIYLNKNKCYENKTEIYWFLSHSFLFSMKCPPFACFKRSRRCGTPSMNFLQRSAETFSFQNFLISRMRSAKHKMFLLSLFNKCFCSYRYSSTYFSWFFMYPHTSSIGLMSGLSGGQSHTSIPFASSIAMVERLAWQGALSCTRIPLPIHTFLFKNSFLTSVFFGVERYEALSDYLLISKGVQSLTARQNHQRRCPSTAYASPYHHFRWKFSPGSQSWKVFTWFNISPWRRAAH